MKSYEEILSDVTSHKYVNESGPILEFVRQLAAEGRIGDVSECILAYVERVPPSKTFILSSLPAIILNSYIYPKTQVTFERFIKWSEENNDWADQIKDSALSAEKLAMTVSNILVSIK